MLYGRVRCILLKFYIKPQRHRPLPFSCQGCILLKFYIKPQQVPKTGQFLDVVSYWNSTSNHNLSFDLKLWGDVVSYWNSTSNHNEASPIIRQSSLYLIEILHQTTTFSSIIILEITLYLIEILHQTTTLILAKKIYDMLYLIEILHQTTTPAFAPTALCKLYLIEILHQTTTHPCFSPCRSCCILLKFYIKPQLDCHVPLFWLSCILLKFYIKPQHRFDWFFLFRVVSYWNSTSNHNYGRRRKRQTRVVSYWNSTSNHNIPFHPLLSVPLYLIEILHQTTTYSRLLPTGSKLYLIEILHQTTTTTLSWCFRRWLYLIEILHQTTTFYSLESIFYRCILLKFYIKPQHTAGCFLLVQSCILLKFYIKPQHTWRHVACCWVVSYWNSTSNHNDCRRGRAFFYVVSYWNSTSNHNWKSFIVCNLVLYLIEILHQTTTSPPEERDSIKLYLIEILHQTTTSQLLNRSDRCCILLKFYIKPQPVEASDVKWRCCILLKFYIKPQPGRWLSCFFGVVSYWNSTSNHNVARLLEIVEMLYLIEILHQTTTAFPVILSASRCILLKFYIKPQPQCFCSDFEAGCILLKFYIKPQLVHHLLPCE